MKIRNKALSFILVLSLLFSSFAFTVGASGISPASDLGIDEEVELFEPTAYYEHALTSQNVADYFADIKATGNTAGFSFRDLWGSNTDNIETYLVKGAQAANAEKGDTENYNEYVMLVPSENAANNKQIASDAHSYIDVAVNKEITYTGTAADTRYLVLEMDVATESTVLPIFYQVTARHREYNGSNYTQDFAFTNAYTPGSNPNSQYTTMTPGVFHHFTLIADTYTNNLYAYLDNKLIDVKANSVISIGEDKNGDGIRETKPYYDNYINKVSTTKILLQGFRIQINNSINTLNGNMSLCYDNIKCYTLLNDDTKNGNLSTVIGGTLNNWSYSGYTQYDPATAQKLPNLININGENYTNIPEAETELNTFELGNSATLRRDVYSGNIVVNSDTVIHTAGAHVSLTQGSDVKLSKADGSTWVATLTGNKYSASIKSVNAGDVTTSLIFSHKDNLIFNINQARAVNEITATNPLTDEEWQLAKELGLDSIIGDDKLISKTEIFALSDDDHSKFTNNSVDGIIFRSYDGLEYLVIQDNTEYSGDFAPNVHYQVNANTAYMNNTAEYMLGGHKYVVFDQDIYTESEFINVYNGFNIRTVNDVSLSSLAVYAEDINVAPGEWHHVTYVGEVETGNSYLFMDGVFVEKLTGGLYDSKALSDNGGGYESMVLASFRTLQVAGENRTGKLMTSEMSAGADNFCLRWADDEGMVNFISRINSGETTDLTEWSGCLYEDGHAEESIVIATIDGVRYYDTTSMTAALSAAYSDTRMRDVVFFRDYVGTIEVNCLATINRACLTERSKLIFDSSCETSVNGNIVTVKRAEIHTTLIQANKQNTGSGIAYGTGNLYKGHDVSGEAWMVGDEGYSYLWDTGVSGNTHTMPIDNGKISSDVTHSTATTNGSIFGSNPSVTVTSTKTQYYYTLELDIAKKSDTSTPTLTFNISFGGSNKSYTIDLTSVLAPLAIGEYAHVTVISTVDVVTSMSYSISSSGSRFSTKIDSASATNSSYNYTVGYKVYVDDAKTSENAAAVTFSNTTSTAITWSNAALYVPVNSQVLLDNVNASIDSTTTTYTTKITTTSTGTAAGTNLASQGATNHATSENLGTGSETPTGGDGVNNAYANSSLAGTNFGSTVTAGGAIPDSYEFPSDDVLEYIADNAVAYIDDTPYTSWNDLVDAIHTKYSASNKTINVTVVKSPDSAVSITANVIIHTGGHFTSTDSLVTAGSGCLTRVNDELNTIEIIVLGNTELIATFNGVDYTDEETLQDVLGIARTAELTFYKLPSAPFSITCPSVIDTNGFDASGIYTTEEFKFQITVDGNIHTIVDETRVGKITVNLIADGKTLTSVYELSYGTDISNYLTQRGVKSNAYVTDSVVYTDITWSPAPEGKVQQSAYVFTATAQNSTPIEEGSHFYIDANGNQSNIATDAELIAKFKESGDGTLILNNDIDLTALSNAMSGTGTKNVYLQGHTITTSLTGDHLFTLNGSGNYNFYGPGTIESTQSTSTHSIFFAGYNYSGSFALDGITVKTTHVLATLRNGNMAFRHCDIDAYTTQNLSGLFSLAEDFNGDYTGNAKHNVTASISLTISESDINFRYANVTDRYGNFTSNSSLIHYKNVTSTDKTTDATDPAYVAFDCKVFIDTSNIYCQGSLVQADASEAGIADAYKHSNLKLYVNESTVIAKSFYKGNIKPSSIIIYDDVRTNVTDITNIAFAMNLVRAKTSDNLSKVYYTSHDYATVVWTNASGGTQEYWASGSIPSHPSYKFFSTDVVVKGQHLDFSDTLNGSSFPFKLFCNLTLSNYIGFNVYIPTGNSVDMIFLNGLPMTKGTFANGDDRISSVTSGGQQIECYDYSVQLPPQEAGKEMTLLIKLSNGLQVTRTISVGEYASKLYTQRIDGKLSSSDIDIKSEAIRVRDLLHVTLSYIEQATMYAGYNVDMSKISEVMNLSGMNTCSYTDKSEYTNYSESFKAAFDGILKGVQINVMDTPAIRFNLAGGVTLTGAEFKIMNDNGELVSRTATVGDGYVEVSLRAYELARDIEVTINGVTATYNLYTYQMKLAEMIAAEQNGGSGIVTGRQREYVAAQKLVEVMFKYATVSDYYLEENSAESVNPNA